MKTLKILLALVLMFTGLNLWSQVAINADGSDPDPSAMLDVQSTNSGILIPRMTAAERDAIPSPAGGLMVFVTDANLFYYYDGNKSGWIPFVSGVSGGDGWQIDGANMYSTVSGNLGIGTTMPDYKLTVDGGHGLIKGDDGWNSSGDQARLFLGDGSHSLFAVHSQGLRIRTHNTSGHSIRWGGSNGVDYVTLNMESGFLGIGTTDPGAKLDVRGWNVDDGVLIQTGNSDMSHKLVLFGGKESDPNPFILWKDGDPLRFCTDQNGWSEKMRIASNGNVGIGIEDPFYKLEVAGQVNINAGITSGIALKVNNYPAIEFLSNDAFRWGGSKTNHFVGDVGLGTSSPTTRLDITGSAAPMRGHLSITDNSDDDPFISFYEGDTFKSFFGCVDGIAQWSAMDGSDMVIGAYGDGNVGIGTTTPDQKLTIQGGDILVKGTNGWSVAGDDAKLNLGDPYHGIKAVRNEGLKLWTYNDFVFENQTGTLFLTIKENSGNVGIGTDNPTEKLEVDGTAKCKILQITGGADLAEPFDIMEHEDVQPGIVMVIDPENPGKLKISEKEYDRCVAGIISGAGEINPGMIMGQTESIADGDHPVALSGRVYCYADASNGNIQPGDLITTSNIPGYAMKSTDSQKSQGAIIGKAMTSLDSGKGLILVLVTLQ